MIPNTFAIQFELSPCITISIQNDTVRSGAECLIAGSNIFIPEV